MLKFKISKEDLAKMPDVIQSEYKGVEGEDGMFILQADGESNDAITNLKAALNVEKLARKAADAKLNGESKATEELTALKSKYAELEALTGKGNADVDLLKKNMQAEIDKLKVTITTQAGELDSMTTQHRDDLLVSTIDEIMPQGIAKSARKDILRAAKAELQFVEKLSDGKSGFVHAESGLGASDWFAKELETSQHWLDPSESGNPTGSHPQGGAASNGAYVDAEKSGNVQGMIANAPIVKN